MANLPPEPFTETPPLAQAMVWFALAGAGGAVKYVSTALKSRDRVSNRRFWSLLAANVFISSFCGLMGGLLMTLMTQERTWSYLSSGIFGYLGTQGLDIVILTLRRKVEPHAQVSAVIPVPPTVDDGNERA